MTSYEERRDKRFFQETKAILNVIHKQLLSPQSPPPHPYSAAYIILRGYFEAILTNFAEAFNEQQIAEIRIVLDQLSRLTGEDQNLDEATKAKQDQLAQALREGKN